MNDENMNKPTEDTGATWWNEMLTRRDANKRIAQVGALAALLASAGVAGCGDSDDDGEIEQKDALDVQKSMGWNAGADDKQLKFSSPSGTDSQSSLNWSTFLDPAVLMQAYQPKNSQWQPYVVPTLAQSLSQQSLKSAMQPFHSSSMDEAYSRGLGMKEILAKTENPQNVIVVADLPGPEAVAYAAALADVADVVTTFDNWPHPTGVVPTHETLGAMLYYAGEVQKKSAERPANAPAVLVLDSNRLTPYSDDSDRFDNRYVAKIPTAENLQAMKVASVLYAVPSDNRNEELDDINEDFVAYKEKGINVAMMPLTNFQPPSAAVRDSLNQALTSTNGSTVHHTTYYYGGHPMYSPWFFSYYPIYTPVYGYSTVRGTAPGTIRRTSYTPAPRKTMFSSRTVGSGKSGIGKQRPTGFGRVSTRTSSSGRTYVGSHSSVRSSGSRSGRSGSFGRSGSRGYSG
jgi:hypothetical protein